LSAGIKIEENVTDWADKFAKEINNAQHYKKAVEIVAGDIRREVKAMVTGQSKGTLARSFRPTFVKRKRSIRFGVYSTLPYASIHETGGIIRPKKGKYLHFKVPKAQRAFSRGRGSGGTGGWVKTKRVVIRRKEYLTAAAERSEPKVANLIGKQLHVAARKATRSAKEKTVK
jgi:hypothetical protein